MGTARMSCMICSLFVVAIVMVSGVAHAQQEGFTPIPVIKGIDSLKPGDKAPLFAVKDLSGSTFDLSKEIGTRAFMLVFWSIYCEPCREEMPLIEKLANQYRAKGMEIMTVNLDGDPFLEAVKGFIKQGKYSFRVLMDELQDENFKIADPYNVAGTPVAYIISKSGKIVFTKVGRATEEELTTQIDKALNMP